MFPRVHVPLIGTHPAIGRWPLPNSTNLPIDENKLENLKSETEWIVMNEIERVRISLETAWLLEP